MAAFLVDLNKWAFTSTNFARMHMVKFGVDNKEVMKRLRAWLRSKPIRI